MTRSQRDTVTGNWSCLVNILPNVQASDYHQAWKLLMTAGRLEMSFLMFKPVTMTRIESCSRQLVVI